IQVGMVEADGQESPQEQGALCKNGRQQPRLNMWSQSETNRLPKQFYWLDRWLFILFDIVDLPFIVYFLFIWRTIK
uniref:Uncharacterized protein n=1 Tax=Theropithecus gelada TaxID=9565 RepID=A0A8D2F871_THEGE